MNEQHRIDPGLYLALAVWFCAAVVFPLQLGIAGASLLTLLLYLGAAGALLSLADALHDPGSYRDFQVALFECVLRVLSLAVPAALAFSFGFLVAPAEPDFGPDDCTEAEFSVAPAAFGEERGKAWHPTEGDCLP